MSLSFAASSPDPSYASLSDLGWDDRWAAHMADLGRNGLRPARVVRRDRGWALVATGDDPVMKVPLSSVGDVATGDWVAIDGERIEAVLPRHGVLRRRNPEGAEQLLACNVDVVLLVCGLDRPVKAGRINRGVVQAWDAGSGVLVVLTKADLSENPDGAVASVQRETPGVDVVTVSSRTGAGLDAVRLALAGQTAVLLGESGAGKSTLLNSLAGEDLAETRGVRGSDAKGRHTTTRRELHVIPGLCRIIDTPGLRAFGIAADSAAVDAAFVDIEALAPGCRFGNCRHESEPGCAVLRAVRAGTLSGGRLEQYRRLQREVASELIRANPHKKRRIERQFAGQLRDVLKLKGRDD
jgi:ribosome biogenesis GTPase / thiamine phosphate phosphatase